MLLELVKNETLYNNRLVHIAGPLNEAIRNISRKFSFSELYEIVGLSNVLKCNIRSVYPNIDYRPHLSILNSTFYYDHDNTSSNTTSNVRRFDSLDPRLKKAKVTSRHKKYRQNVYSKFIF